MKRAVLLVGGLLEVTEMFVRNLKKRGYAVVVVDHGPERLATYMRYKERTPNHYTHLVDKWVMLPSGDDSLETLLSELNHLALDYEVAGVIACQEKAVIPSAILADYFGVPGIGQRAAIIARNKYKMREVMRGTPWGVQSKMVRFGDIRPEELSDSGVLKPVSEQGSFNVVLWSTAEQRNEALAALTVSNPQQLFLVEEKITGPEYSIECWVQKGKIVYSAISLKGTMVPDGLEFPVETLHHTHYTGLPDEVEAQVHQMAEHVVEHGFVQNAIVHLEFKVDETGTPRVMEWALRNPGDRIMDLYLFAGAIDPTDLVIRCMLHEEIPAINAPTRITYQQFLFLGENDRLHEDYNHKEMVEWVGNPNYAGFVRNLDGYAFDELPGVTLFDVGVITPADSAPTPVTQSNNRHYYVVYATDLDVNQEFEDRIVDFIFSHVLTKNTVPAAV